ncbi:hypothetical protein SK128_011876 [Halocaridina rubra]|uniref:Uncharacterized protein n=1 Tax=Halocaridina rubra TaxID=373956 RepID=A0AAN9A9G0_HALRR
MREHGSLLENIVFSTTKQILPTMRRSSRPRILPSRFWEFELPDYSVTQDIVYNISELTRLNSTNSSFSGRKKRKVLSGDEQICSQKNGMDETTLPDFKKPRHPLKHSDINQNRKVSDDNCAPVASQSLGPRKFNANSVAETNDSGITDLDKSCSPLSATNSQHISHSKKGSVIKSILKPRLGMRPGINKENSYFMSRKKLTFRGVLSSTVIGPEDINECLEVHTPPSDKITKKDLPSQTSLLSIAEENENISREITPVKNCTSFKSRNLYLESFSIDVPQIKDKMNKNYENHFKAPDKVNTLETSRTIKNVVNSSNSCDKVKKHINTNSQRRNVDGGLVTSLISTSKRSQGRPENNSKLISEKDKLNSGLRPTNNRTRGRPKKNLEEMSAKDERETCSNSRNIVTWPNVGIENKNAPGYSKDTAGVHVENQKTNLTVDTTVKRGRGRPRKDIGVKKNGDINVPSPKDNFDKSTGPCNKVFEEVGSRENADNDKGKHLELSTKTKNTAIETGLNISENMKKRKHIIGKKKTEASLISSTVDGYPCKQTSILPANFDMSVSVSRLHPVHPPESVACRRSKRIRTKPLEYWNFEKAEVKIEGSGEISVIYRKINDPTEFRKHSKKTQLKNDAEITKKGNTRKSNSISLSIPSTSKRKILTPDCDALNGSKCRKEEGCRKVVSGSMIHSARWLFVQNHDALYDYDPQVKCV